jgi:cell division protein FtsQ
MPLEMPDPDGDNEQNSNGGRSVRSRADGIGNDRSGRWWRPTSTAGRVFLGLGTLIVLGGVSTGIFLLKNYLERDERFRIAGASNIQAAGLNEVSRAQMLPVFGEDIGRNIFFVPLKERRKQLEQIPWVQRATVMRLLPDQIRVSVVERQPVAFTRQGQQIGLVDANGVLLTMSAAAMTRHHYSFPVVTGIDPRDPLPSRTARMDVYKRLLAELDAHNQHLSEQISEIDLTDPEDARVLMPEQGADILAHFGEDQFLARYQRYKAHIAEWRQQYPKLAAVDLRYDQQVVLEMAPGTKAVQETVGEGTAADGIGGKISSGEPVLTDSKANTAADASDSSSKKTPALTGKTSKDGAAGDKAAKERAAKAAAAKDKAAQQYKKTAVANPAALNTNQQQPSAATQPTAPEGE